MAQSLLAELLEEWWHLSSPSEGTSRGGDLADGNPGAWQTHEGASLPPSPLESSKRADLGTWSMMQLPIPH